MERSTSDLDLEEESSNKNNLKGDTQHVKHMTQFAEYRGIAFNITLTQFVVFTAPIDGPQPLFFGREVSN